MKFRFCGEGDCPDWVLAEINTLSRLSSVKLKALSELVAKSIVNPPFDIDEAVKLFADSKLDKDIDLKTSIACITFALGSAVNFNCDPGLFSSELQQLGLPREHSQAIRKVYTNHSANLAASLRSKSLRIRPLKEVTATANDAIRCVSLQIEVDDNKQTVNLSKEQAEMLLKELKAVRELMNQFAMIDHAI